MYQFLQASDKFAARNFACAECGEVGRVHLAIDHAELPAFKLPGEMRQRDLRGVADVTEHGFAVEHASDADTIQTTDQLAVHPGFHGMRVAQPMQCAIRRNHVFVYPGAGMAGSIFGARSGAATHHLFENSIAAHFMDAVAQHFGKRARDLEFTRDQHHARIRTPPQYGLAGIEPREYSIAVGFQQTRYG